MGHRCASSAVPPGPTRILISPSLSLSPQVSTASPTGSSPPPAFEGDVYQARDLPQVPHSLNEAIDALEKSTWARDVLGEDVVSHYLHFFKTEQRKFDSVVTDYERRRYFEQA